MTNIYWPVYKSLEKELLDLTYSIHVDDNQLKVYSSKILDLIIRCAIEIESISKELYLKEGGVNKKNIKYDETAIKFLNKKWLLDKKVVILSSANCFQTKRILLPFEKKEPRENGRLTFKWNLCYQGIKHNRRENLPDGNLENLFSILSALYLLNVYFKKEQFSIGKDSKGDDFSHNLGSEIFSIKVHPNGGFNQHFDISKDKDFEECSYFVLLAEYHEKKIKDFLQNANQQFYDLIKTRQGFNELDLDVNSTSFLFDEKVRKFLSSEEYMKIINICFRGINDVTTNSTYLAKLNINKI